MDPARLADIYRSYIDCLNAQEWQALNRFVRDDVQHNGRLLGERGYREMLEQNFSEIPDLRFEIALLVSQPPLIASRLAFHCTPKATFLGVAVNGRQVSFTENVFYEFRDEKIARVWSVIDKAAIEAQIG